MNLNATILGQAIAFFLFVWFCMKYIWPPIMATIEKRQEEITKGLALAERSKKEMELLRLHVADHLKNAKKEALSCIEQANKRKAQIMDAAQNEAKLERNKIMAQAHSEIKAELMRAREELHKQTAMLAMIGAEKIIERSVDKTTSNAILDKLIDEL